MRIEEIAERIIEAAKIGKYYSSDEDDMVTRSFDAIIKIAKELEDRE